MAKKIGGVDSKLAPGLEPTPIQIPEEGKLIKAQIKKASNELYVVRNKKLVGQHCYKSKNPYPVCTLDCPAAIAIEVPEKEREAFREKYVNGISKNVDSLKESSLTIRKKSEKDSLSKVDGGVFVKICTGAVIEVFNFEK